MFRWMAMVALVSAVTSARAAPADQVPFGHFEGEVVTKWLKDGRSMELIDAFAYVDSAGVRWVAPKGSIVDGASIPKMAWSIIGGPFEGKYREASVLHDVACVNKTKPWQAVHYMFYEGMLANGVGSKKAKTMYAAVYHFGPRWERVVVAKNVSEYALNQTLDAMESARFAAEVKKVTVEELPVTGTCTNPPCAPPEHKYDVTVRFQPVEKVLTQDAFAQLQARIEADDLSLEEIDAFGVEE